MNRIRSTLSSARAVLVLAAIAVLFLAAGFALRGLVVSPAEVEAERQPPPPGLITAPIEQRQITSTIITRGDVAFTEPAGVRPTIPEGAVSAVVTGRVPAVGDVVEAGTVLLEVSGRPIFALAGDFPAYRTLGPGMSGPDVGQVRAALSALGFAAGEAGQTSYDEPLAEAIKAFYESHGYAAPAPLGGAGPKTVRAAQDAVDGANRQVDSAGRQLDDAGATLNQTRTDAQARLSAAETALTEANNRLNAALASPAPSAPPADGTGATSPPADPPFDIDALRAAASAAQAEVDAARQAVNDANRATIADQEAALADARKAAERAAEDLLAAQEAAWTPLPAGEVVFLAELPRRVDVVNVGLGQMIGDGDALLVSGTELDVSASVSAREAGLLAEAMTALLVTPLGDLEGTIRSIEPGPAGVDGQARSILNIAVTGQVEGDKSELVGNIQVRLTVGTSSADAIVVPVAAVSADAAGAARIELVDGELINGLPAAEQATRMVQITPGISAEGYVEVLESETPLKAGELVVIGSRTAEATNPPSETSPPGSPTDATASDATP